LPFPKRAGSGAAKALDNIAQAARPFKKNDGGTIYERENILSKGSGKRRRALTKKRKQRSAGSLKRAESAPPGVDRSGKSGYNFQYKSRNFLFGRQIQKDGLSINGQR
jgi:hypothetical protein